MIYFKVSSGSAAFVVIGSDVAGAYPVKIATRAGRHCCAKTYKLWSLQRATRIRRHGNDPLTKGDISDVYAF